MYMYCPIHYNLWYVIIYMIHMYVSYDSWACPIQIYEIFVLLGECRLLDSKLSLRMGPLFIIKNVIIIFLL